MKVPTWISAVAVLVVAAPLEAQAPPRSRAEAVRDAIRAEKETIEQLRAGDPAAERIVVGLLTAGDEVSWEVGVFAALSVDPERRSPALRTAMIEALRLEVERTTAQDVLSQVGESGDAGETSAILARHLAATGDPAVLPSLAWHAYNAGPVAAILYEFGLQAVPHLVKVALSPRAAGDVAGPAIHVLASIVSTHGPGPYEQALVEAALLHMDGPPTGYLSAGLERSGRYTSALTDAIALAGALRGPILTERLDAMAASTPEEISETTGFDLGIATQAPACARGQLDGSLPEPAGCDPRTWVGMCDRFVECRQFKLNRRIRDANTGFSERAVRVRPATLTDEADVWRRLDEHEGKLMEAMKKGTVVVT